MAASIAIVKTITYRGTVEEFVNRYHFSGGAPADDAHWLALDSAIRTAERAIYQAGRVNIIRSIGYTADETPSVWERTFTTAATGAFAQWNEVPGDCACWIRYSTARRDSRGHPVYLRNYYHGVGSQSGGAIDTFNPAQKTAFDTYGSAWVAGFSDGDVTHLRTGPDSLGATARATPAFIGRRKLKRRG